MNRMMGMCDLHTHSVFSDGTLTPEEIVDKATEIGLSAVALCDHNTVDGVLPFLSAAKGKNTEAIAGAEFSVDFCGTELHLLGLFIPEESLGIISDLMTDVNRKKEESNIRLVESLNRAGYSFDYAKIKAGSPSGKINRAHVAAALTEKGYTESIKQAFDTLLSKDGGHYVEPERLTVFEMIAVIKKIGAVPVLAHPFLNLSEERLMDFMPSAKECGLIGMECFYATYDEETVEKSLKIANAFGLKPSGGSDFHGSNKPDIKLGVGKDNLKIPYSYAEALKGKQAE